MKGTLFLLILLLVLHTASPAVREYFCANIPHSFFPNAIQEVLKQRICRCAVAENSHEVDTPSYSTAPLRKTNAYQRTLAIIKPDAYPQHKDAILFLLSASALNVHRQKEVKLSLAQAREFYREHQDKPFYDELTQWMSSTPIYAMELRGPNAIKAWRDMLGPTNSERARKEKPQSVRAKFGKDGSWNAAHGSDSVENAEREINIVFGEENIKERGGQINMGAAAPRLIEAAGRAVVKRLVYFYKAVNRRVYEHVIIPFYGADRSIMPTSNIEETKSFISHHAESTSFSLSNGNTPVLATHDPELKDREPKPIDKSNYHASDQSARSINKPTTIEQSASKRKYSEEFCRFQSCGCKVYMI
ncbi:uncharacterized protein VTP21DRAFT_1601 [Calcarisporiella thermophila]|uniref:uncharacterized protein n=1 Tax=Calcarisporiella thermophila TaxID=911321 RepID=UPI003742A991